MKVFGKPAVKVVLFDIVPEGLNGIEARRIGWQKEWNKMVPGEVLCSVPGGVVEHHKGSFDLLCASMVWQKVEEHLKGDRVDRPNDQGDEVAGMELDGADEVGLKMFAGEGPSGQKCPASFPSYHFAAARQSREH